MDIAIVLGVLLLWMLMIGLLLGLDHIGRQS